MEYAKEVAEQTGLVPAGKYGWLRHPLAYLTEAADDICYLLADIEDGIDVGDYRVADLYDLLGTYLKGQRAVKGWEFGFKKLDHTNQKIAFLRSNVMYVLVTQVAEKFLDSETAMIEGRYYDYSRGKSFYRPLLKEIRSRETKSFLECLGEIPKKYLYYGPRKMYIEVAYHKVVHGLLDAFTAAVLDEGRSIKSQHLVRLMGRDLPIEETNPEQKLRSVVDFISGMTDRFALGMYRQLEGISLGGMPSTVLGHDDSMERQHRV